MIEQLAIYTFLTGIKGSGKTSLREVIKEDLEDFIEREQDRKLMISTIRTKLNFVNAFLRQGIEEGMIPADVLTRKIRLKRPDTLPRAMDPDDVRQLLSVVGSLRDRALVLVLLRTGMRIGKLLNIRLADVHLNERKIEIYEGEKNRLGRVVYLSADVVGALKQWLAIRDPRRGFLFYAAGHPTMSYSKARTLFNTYLQRAGLNNQGLYPTLLAAHLCHVTFECRHADRVPTAFAGPQFAGSNPTLCPAHGQNPRGRILPRHGDY